MIWILPLLFVSPQQINAQLPSSLTPGNYTLEIQSTGQPNISGTFTVARNAPGLFFQTINSVNYAMALHADGSLGDNGQSGGGRRNDLAARNGFWALSEDGAGWILPAHPAAGVDDSVTLSVGGVNPSSTSTAAPGFTGLDLTQFKVPTGLPSGSPCRVWSPSTGWTATR